MKYPQPSLIEVLVYCVIGAKQALGRPEEGEDRRVFSITASKGVNELYSYPTGSRFYSGLFDAHHPTPEGSIGIVISLDWHAGVKMEISDMAHFERQ
jgi:hypothetical protein